MKSFKQRAIHKKIIIVIGIAFFSSIAFIAIYNYFSLKHAVISNDIALLRFLIKIGHTPTNQEALSLLRLAIADGHKEISEILLSHGADINVQDAYDYTLLDEAILFKRNEMAKFLIDKGIQLNERNLYTAAHNGNKEMTGLLITKGINVNAVVKPKVLGSRPCPCCPTPLMTAASNNHTDVIEMLLKHGANINGNKGCYTPLHAASSGRAGKAVRLLLSKGAQVNAKDGDGHTPLYYATLNEDIDVQKALIAADAARK